MAAAKWFLSLRRKETDEITKLEKAARWAYKKHKKDERDRQMEVKGTMYDSTTEDVRKFQQGLNRRLELLPPQDRSRAQAQVFDDNDVKPLFRSHMRLLEERRSIGPNGQQTFHRYISQDAGTNNRAFGVNPDAGKPQSGNDGSSNMPGVDDFRSCIVGHRYNVSELLKPGKPSSMLIGCLQGLPQLVSFLNREVSSQLLNQKDAPTLVETLRLNAKAGKTQIFQPASTDDLAPGNVVLIGQSGFAVIDYIHNETADGSDMAILALHSAFDPFSHLICAAVQKDQNIFLMFLAADDGILTETSMHCAFESLRYKETELATRDPLLNNMKMLLRSADQFLGRIDVQALLRGQSEALDVRAFDGDDTAFDLLRLMSDPAEAMADMTETQDILGVLDYPGLLGGRSYDGLAFLPYLDSIPFKIRVGVQKIARSEFRTRFTDAKASDLRKAVDNLAGICIPNKQGEYQELADVACRVSEEIDGRLHRLVEKALDYEQLVNAVRAGASQLAGFKDVDKDKAERLVSAYSVRECLGPFTAAGGLLDAYVTISTARRLLESASLESLQAQLKTLSSDASTQDQTLQAVRAKIAKTGTQAAELTELRGQEIKLQQLSDASALRIAECKECISAKSSGKIQAWSDKRVAQVVLQEQLLRAKP